jgi:hypothetical protein
MTNRIPAAPRFCCRFVRALVTISFAGPGVAAEMFVIRLCVVDFPSRPTTETRASSAGKIERMP